MINGVNRIFDFGYKVLYRESEMKPFKGRECGEALDPVLNLHHRLEENSVVLVEERKARESVITLATLLNPSSLPVLPQIYPNLRQNLDSSIPISPEPRSCSSSGYCSDSDASSIQDEVFTDSDVDQPDLELSSEALPASPKVASKTNLTIAMEETEDDTLAKTNEVMAIYDVIDVDDREIVQGYREELANMKELLVVSNAETRRLNAVNDSLQAKELELLERRG